MIIVFVSILLCYVSYQCSFIYTVDQLIFADIYFHVFVFGDIFGVIYFRGFQILEKNICDFILLGPIEVTSMQ